MSLINKKCIPCQVGMPSLSENAARKFIARVPGWELNTEEPMKIRRTFVHDNFAQAMTFVNIVAELAEAEGHHPDIHIHYNEVTIELWTHKSNGLHENDFIIAAKINQLL